MMDLFNSGIRPVVDSWLLKESQEKRDYGEYFSASSAGYCQRKVIFDRLGVPHVEKDDDARKQRVFTAGHLFHDWIQGITKGTGLSIAQEMELQDENLMIRGHFDDLVLIDDKLILYDYKTVNSRSFQWAKKNGNAMSYYHKYQLATYMYMLREEYKGLTEARILKLEKDTLMMGEQQLLWSAELESEVLEYWNSLNAHWNNKTIPECTCADHENGFLAKEKYNSYFYEGEPCSIEWFAKMKKEGLLAGAVS